MLMEAHFQRPLLAQFPGGREPQHHNAAPAALQSLPQACAEVPTVHTRLEILSRLFKCKFFMSQ